MNLKISRLSGVREDSPIPYRRAASLFVLLMLTAYAYAFFVGFRMPNLWSINYFIPSVFEGFYRRSLVGSLLYVFGELRFNYYFISLLQVCIFLLLNLFMLRAAYRHRQYRWILVLFFIAPTGGYFFHQIGYVDQLLFLVLIGAIYASSAVVASILLVASVFIHEMSVFFTIPLFVAMKTYRGDMFRHIALQVAPALASFLLIYLFFQLPSREAVLAFLGHLASVANHPVRADYYEVFLNDFTGARNKIYYAQNDVPKILSAIPLYALAAYVFSKKGTSRPQKIKLAGAGMAAAVSPLTLGFFGWDTSRWIFLSVASVAFCLYVARESLDMSLLKKCAACFLVFMLVADLEYFDGYDPKARIERGIPFFFLHELGREMTRVPSI